MLLLGQRSTFTLKIVCFLFRNGSERPSFVSIDVPIDFDSQVEVDWRRLMSLAPFFFFLQLLIQIFAPEMAPSREKMQIYANWGGFMRVFNWSFQCGSNDDWLATRLTSSSGLNNWFIAVWLNSIELFVYRRFSSIVTRLALTESVVLLRWLRWALTWTGEAKPAPIFWRLAWNCFEAALETSLKRILLVNTMKWWRNVKHRRRVCVNWKRCQCWIDEPRLSPMKPSKWNRNQLDRLDESMDE